jgi:hypothetical protein
MPMGCTPHSLSGPLDVFSIRGTQLTLSHERLPMISLVITLIVIGVLLWLVNTYIPMDGKIKQILNAVVVICVVVWLLSAFGVLGHSGDIAVPQVK